MRTDILEKNFQMIVKLVDISLCLEFRASTRHEFRGMQHELEIALFPVCGLPHYGQEMVQVLAVRPEPAEGRYNMVICQLDKGQGFEGAIYTLT